MSFKAENCPHCQNGWCLDCIHDLEMQIQALDKAIKELKEDKEEE